MKLKILAIGVLSMVGWALSTSNASALWLLPHCFHRNYSVIVCRPYNAFTPICCGSMVCDGCCPSPYCGAPRNFAPMYSGCVDGACFAGDHAYATPGPSMHLPAPTQGPMPVPGAPNFTPPPPTPNPVYNQTSLPGNPQALYGVQPAGYYPGYPMNYYPVNNYPMAPSMPAPHYWYGR